MNMLTGFIVLIERSRIRRQLVRAVVAMLAIAATAFATPAFARDKGAGDLQEAVAGQSVTLTLADELDVLRQTLEQPADAIHAWLTEAKRIKQQSKPQD